MTTQRWLRVRAAATLSFVALGSLVACGGGDDEESSANSITVWI